MGIYKRYFGKYKLMFFTAVTCVFLEVICDLLQPTIMARIIDDGVRGGQMEVVVQLGILMLFITALGAVLATFRNILASRVSQSFGKDLREEVFAKIMNFSENSTDSLDSGSLITRMTNDTSQVVQFVNGLMRIFFRAPLMGIGSVLFAVILSPKLSLVLLLVLLIVTGLITISMKMSYRRFTRVQYAMDRLNGVVQEYLMGIRLIKAFGRHGDEEAKFGKANEDLMKRGISSQVVIAYFAPLLSLVVSLGIAFVLYLGSLLFMGGEIEVGKVAAFINYMAQVLMSLIMITNIFNTFVRTRASTERITEVLESEGDLEGEKQGLLSERTAFSFDHVTFAYPQGSGIPALTDLSFRVGKGETLAIIGPTGSGKSTIAWLALRFYDVDGGTITLDGIDIWKLGTASLRKNIALSSQKTMLFSGTVSENIAWGEDEVSFQDVQDAAKAAQAHDFITGMPLGYDSLIGQGAVNLSGGQKQRISIARALVKRSPLLILDDSTSSLDVVTDARVRQGIRKHSPDRTQILITQRIGTALGADRILVLDNGRRVGFGSHQELMVSCQTYRELYDSQIGEEGGGV